MKITPKVDMVFEEGTYPATVVSIEQKETEKYGTRLLWTFEIEDEGKAYAKDQFTSISDSPMSNLIKWGTTLLGDLDGELDTDDLEGKPCRVVITNDYDEDTKQEKSRISKVRAPADKQKGRPSKPAPIDEDEESFDEIPF